MAKPPLTAFVDRIGERFTPTPDTIRRKLQAARDIEQTREAEWRAAAADTEGGGDPKREAAAEAGLTKARRDVQRLEAIFGEVDGRRAASAADAERAAVRARDTATAEAFDELAAAGAEAERAVAAYVTAYERLSAAWDKVQPVAAQNPKLRRDLLLSINVPAAFGHEIGRLAIAHGTPRGAPGASGMLLASDPREAKTLGAQFAELAACVRKELGQ